MDNKYLNYLPRSLQFVARQIRSFGFESYLVGGAIRDLLLGYVPKDFDIEVHGACSIDQLEQLLRKTGIVDPVGKSFGVLKYWPYDKMAKYFDMNSNLPASGLILPIGISGSGKTTWISSIKDCNKNLVVVSLDDLRRRLAGDVSNQSKNREVVSVAIALIAKAILEGKLVVLDATNVDSQNRNELIGRLVELVGTDKPFDYYYTVFGSDRQTSINRIRGDLSKGVDRSDVPDSVIDTQLEKFNESIKIISDLWNMDVPFDICVPRSEKVSANNPGEIRVELDPNLSLEKSILRRDFTINALLLDPLNNNQIFDYCNGLQDLDGRIIRHVSDQFDMDPFRILRAMEFQNRLGFSIAPETMSIIRKMVLDGKLKLMAKERIAAHWLKWATSGRHHDLVIDFIEQSGMYEKYFPELFNESNKDHLKKSLAYFESAENTDSADTAILRFATLLSNVKDLNVAGGYLAEFGINNENNKLKVIELIDSYRTIFGSAVSVSSVMKVLLNAKHINSCMLLQYIEACKNQDVEINSIRQIFSTIDSIYPQGIKPFLNGNEISEITHKTGKEIGLIMDLLVQEQANQKIINHDQAISWLTNDYPNLQKSDLDNNTLTAGGTTSSEGSNDDGNAICAGAKPVMEENMPSYERILKLVTATRNQRVNCNRMINVLCYDKFSIINSNSDNNFEAKVTVTGYSVITKKEHSIIFDTVVSVLNTPISSLLNDSSPNAVFKIMDISSLGRMDATNSKKYKLDKTEYELVKIALSEQYKKGYRILGYGSDAKTGTVYLLKKEYNGVNILERVLSALGIFTVDKNDKQFNHSRWEILYQPAVEFKLSKAYEMQVVSLMDSYSVKGREPKELPGRYLDGVTVVPDALIEEIVSDSRFGEDYREGFKGILYSPTPAFGVKGLMISYSFYEDIRRVAPRLPSLNPEIINVLKGAYKWGVKKSTLSTVWIHSHLLGSAKECKLPVQFNRFCELNNRADGFISTLPNDTDETIKELIHHDQYEFSEDDFDTENVLTGESDSTVNGRVDNDSYNDIDIDPFNYARYEDIMYPDLAKNQNVLTESYVLILDKLISRILDPKVKGTRNRKLLCAPIEKGYVYVPENILPHEKFVWISRMPLLHPEGIYRLSRHGWNHNLVLMDEMVGGDNDGDTVTILPDIMVYKPRFRDEFWQKWNCPYDKGDAPAFALDDDKIDEDNKAIAYECQLIEAGRLVSFGNMAIWCTLYSQSVLNSFDKLSQDAKNKLNEELKAVCDSVQAVTLAMKHSYESIEVKRYVINMIERHYSQSEGERIANASTVISRTMHQYFAIKSSASNAYLKSAFKAMVKGHPQEIKVDSQSKGFVNADSVIYNFYMCISYAKAFNKVLGSVSGEYISSVVGHCRATLDNILKLKGYRLSDASANFVVGNDITIIPIIVDDKLSTFNVAKMSFNPFTVDNFKDTTLNVKVQYTDVKKLIRLLFDRSVVLEYLEAWKGVKSNYSYNKDVISTLPKPPGKESFFDYYFNKLDYFTRYLGLSIFKGDRMQLCAAFGILARLWVSKNAKDRTLFKMPFNLESDVPITFERMFHGIPNETLFAATIAHGAGDIYLKNNRKFPLAIVDYGDGETPDTPDPNYKPCSLLTEHLIKKCIGEQGATAPANGTVKQSQVSNPAINKPQVSKPASVATAVVKKQEHSPASTTKAVTKTTETLSDERVSIYVYGVPFTMSKEVISTFAYIIASADNTSIIEKVRGIIPPVNNIKNQVSCELYAIYKSVIMAHSKGFKKAKVYPSNPKLISMIFGKESLDAKSSSVLSILKSKIHDLGMSVTFEYIESGTIGPNGSVRTESEFGNMVIEGCSHVYEQYKDANINGCVASQPIQSVQNSSDVQTKKSQVSKPASVAKKVTESPSSVSTDDKVSQKIIAISGTRNPDSLSINECKKLCINILEKTNAIIITGGALGIDSEVSKMVYDYDPKRLWLILPYKDFNSIDKTLDFSKIGKVIYLDNKSENYHRWVEIVKETHPIYTRGRKSLDDFTMKLHVRSAGMLTYANYMYAFPRSADFTGKRGGTVQTLRMAKFLKVPYMVYVSLDSSQPKWLDENNNICTNPLIAKQPAQDLASSVQVEKSQVSNPVNNKPQVSKPVHVEPTVLVSKPTTVANQQHKYAIFTDGSKNVVDDQVIVTYAYVILDNGQKIAEGSGIVPKGLDKSLNVAGELAAVQHGFENVARLGIKVIDYYYDYNGPYSWLTGAWHVKDDLTKFYVDAIRDIINSNGITVNYYHVKSHTKSSVTEDDRIKNPQVYWNDYVDKQCTNVALNHKNDPPNG